jgi:hypothetical protein
LLRYIESVGFLKLKSIRFKACGKYSKFYICGGIMYASLISALKSHVDDAGVEGLLPQNLPDSILNELTSLFFRDRTKKTVNVSGDRLAPALFCVRTVLEHQKKASSDFELGDLLHALEVYSANLGLELVARKHNFEISPAVSVSDIFSADREVTLPKDFLTGD